MSVYNRDIRKVLVTKERDVRTHAELWHTSTCLLEAARKLSEGQTHQFRGSLVFAAFSLEAYLNWLGDQLISSWDEKQRVDEKLTTLCHHLGVTIDLGKRPGQVLSWLFSFRNEIAHGKPENISTERKHHPSYLDKEIPPQDIFEKTTWERCSDEKHAKQAREDVRQICEILHQAAKFEDESEPFDHGMQTTNQTGELE